MHIPPNWTRWYTNWQARREQKHRSEWDSPVTGTDLLGSMLAVQHRKQRPLP